MIGGKTKDMVARELAQSYAEAEEAVSKVIRVVSDREDDESEPIKLLEINADTPAAGVVPVIFGSSDDVPYPSIVVEVTPEEFRKIEGGELDLPEGWKLGQVLVDTAA